MPGNETSSGQAEERRIVISQETRKVLIMTIITLWELAEDIQGEDDPQEKADLCRAVTMEVDKLVQVFGVTDKELLSVDASIT
jgi:hypothetical protein